MYSSESSGDVIVIRSAEVVELGGFGGNAAGKASVEVRWLPKPKLVIQCEFTLGQVPKRSEQDQYTMKIPSAQVSATVDCFKRVDVGNATIMTLVPKFHSIERKLESKLYRVGFHLTNLPNFLDLIGGRIELEADDWQIMISPVNNLLDQVEELKLSGGYSITHVGEIRRTDNKAFDLENVNDLLTALGHFFSFVRGSWVLPLLPIGYNSTDSVVWEQWGMKKAIPGETFYRGSMRRTDVQFRISSQVSGANGKMRRGRMVLSQQFIGISCLMTVLPELTLQ